MPDLHDPELRLALHSVVESGLSALDGDDARERLYSESVQAVVREIVRLDADGVTRLATRATRSTGTLLAELAASVLENEARGRLLTPQEKLARANLRGIAALRALLAEHGGCYRAGEVAERLGISRQAVHKRSRARQLLALRQGEHLVYPAWQFEGTGMIAGFAEVLRALDTASAVAKVRFFLSPDERLGGRTPLEALRAGDEQVVLTAARRFGRHGAD